MELSRLRAENKRLTMELEIAKKNGELREGDSVKYARVDSQRRLFGSITKTERTVIVGSASE
jgi:hypothetical protein